MKKVTFSIEYNPVSKTWCLFKNIEGNQSYNFYPVIQSDNKKDCQKKLKEITKEREDISKKQHSSRKKSMYELYLDGKLIDTDTKDNLYNKYEDLKHNAFYPSYFYKKPRKNYKVVKVNK